MTRVTGMKGKPRMRGMTRVTGMSRGTRMTQLIRITGMTGKDEKSEMTVTTTMLLQEYLQEFSIKYALPYLLVVFFLPVWLFPPPPKKNFPTRCDLSNFLLISRVSNRSGKRTTQTARGHQLNK